MKTLLDTLEREAHAQVAEARKLRETPVGGKNLEERFRRAKIAIGIIGGFVRLKATLSNEETNRLVSLRLEGQHDEEEKEKNKKGTKALHASVQSTAGSSRD